MFGELDTYAISQFMPMEPEIYFRLFVRQNQAVWPSQLLTFGLVMAALALAWRGRNPALGGSLSGLVIGACWAWVGWSFFLQLYAELNWAAVYIGWAFMVEGGFLLLYGLAGSLGRAAGAQGLSQRTGALIIVFALLVYPFLGPLTGRTWQALELVGSAPDPTAMATLGLLLLSRRLPWLLGIIPLIWCLYSGATWWAMGWTAGLIVPAVALLWLAVISARWLRRH